MQSCANWYSLVQHQLLNFEDISLADFEENDVILIIGRQSANVRINIKLSVGSCTGY